MTAGHIGGIAGLIIGAIGGIIGTVCSIRNTNGPRERAFMVRASVIMWVAGFFFIALLLLLPTPYRWFMWLPYGILLPIAIITWNRTQQRIRSEESSEAEQADPHFS